MACTAQPKYPAIRLYYLEAPRAPLGKDYLGLVEGIYLCDKEI
jgi:hypothetical protein